LKFVVFDVNRAWLPAVVESQ